MFLVFAVLLAALPLGVVLNALDIEAAEEASVQLEFPEGALSAAGCSKSNKRITKKYEKSAVRTNFDFLVCTRSL